MDMGDLFCKSESVSFRWCLAEREVRFLSFALVQLGRVERRGIYAHGDG